MQILSIAALCAAGRSYVSALHAEAGLQVIWKITIDCRAASSHTEDAMHFRRDVKADTDAEIGGWSSSMALSKTSLKRCKSTASRRSGVPPPIWHACESALA